jgi:hypothetical protein
MRACSERWRKCNTGISSREWLSGLCRASRPPLNEVRVVMNGARCFQEGRKQLDHS